jgi:hypothetical protein
MKKFIIFFMVFFCGCGPDPIPDPEAAILLSPENLNNCSSASRVNDSERQVRFQWTKALFAERYELIVKNSVTQESFYINTTLLNESLILPGASPYQWFVRSKSSLTPVTKDSSSWQFYLEGDPNTNYLPFPAILLAPQDNATVSLSDSDSFLLEWEGNDLDDDIISYDLYLGIDPNQLTLKEDKINSTEFSIILELDNKYYWQIITHDESQNQSKSSIFSFQTN